MANKGSIAALIADINDKIKRNLQQAITGPRLNGVLNDVVDTLDSLKQDTIEDLAAIRQGAEKGATAYQKPADGIPASDIKQGVIPDVSQFITKSVNDLVNYYRKSETYTQAEVNALIGAISHFHYEIYPTLGDVTTPMSNVLYLIGPTGSGTDQYEEYVYPDAQTGWKKIGDTSIDLSGYVTTSALNTALADYTTTANLTTLLAAKEDVAGKVTSLSSASTDQQYPSAKCVYDAIFGAMNANY